MIVSVRHFESNFLNLFRLVFIFVIVNRGDRPNSRKLDFKFSSAGHQYYFETSSAKNLPISILQISPHVTTVYHLLS